MIKEVILQAALHLICPLSKSPDDCRGETRAATCRGPQQRASANATITPSNSPRASSQPSSLCLSPPLLGSFGHTEPKAQTPQHSAEMHNVGRRDTQLQNCADLLLGLRVFDTSTVVPRQCFDDAPPQFSAGRMSVARLCNLTRFILPAP